MDDSTDPISFGLPEDRESTSQTPVVSSPSESQVEPSKSVNLSD